MNSQQPISTQNVYLLFIIQVLSQLQVKEPSYHSPYTKRLVNIQFTSIDSINSTVQGVKYDHALQDYFMIYEKHDGNCFQIRRNLLKLPKNTSQIQRMVYDDFEQHFMYFQQLDDRRARPFYAKQNLMQRILLLKRNQLVEKQILKQTIEFPRQSIITLFDVFEGDVIYYQFNKRVVFESYVTVNYRNQLKRIKVETEQNVDIYNQQSFQTLALRFIGNDRNGKKQVVVVYQSGDTIDLKVEFDIYRLENNRDQFIWMKVNNIMNYKVSHDQIRWMKDGSYNIFNNQYSYYDHSSKIGLICIITSKCHLLQIFPNQNIKIGLIINQSFYHLLKKHTLLQMKVSNDQSQILLLFSNNKLYMANLDDFFTSSVNFNQITNKLLDQLDTKAMDFQKVANRLIIRVLTYQGDYLNIYLEGNHNQSYGTFQVISQLLFAFLASLVLHFFNLLTQISS